MIRVLQTATFRRWLQRLRDRRAKDRIAARILRVEAGHLGDVSVVGRGVSEMRIQYGPGYRLYFVQRGSDLIILLCGGDKSSQRRDIERARRIVQELEV